MGLPAQRIPSFEELYQAIEALPPGLTGEILEPGAIRVMGRPGGAHRLGARRIWRALDADDAGEGGHGWWLEQEAEIRLLGKRLAVPDLSGWRLADSEAVPPAFVYENPITAVPDWCCELLSPSTENIDRQLKVELYASAGVEWIWLVDPQRHRIEVLRTADGKAEPLQTIEADYQGILAPFSSHVDTRRWWMPPHPRS